MAWCGGVNLILFGPLYLLGLFVTQPHPVKIWQKRVKISPLRSYELFGIILILRAVKLPILVVFSANLFSLKKKNGGGGRIAERHLFIDKTFFYWKFSLCTLRFCSRTRVKMPANCTNKVKLGKFMQSFVSKSLSTCEIS